MQACNQTQRLYNQAGLSYTHTLTQSCLCNLLHNPDVQHVNTDKCESSTHLPTFLTQINEFCEYLCLQVHSKCVFLWGAAPCCGVCVLLGVDYTQNLKTLVTHTHNNALAVFLCCLPFVQILILCSGS